jgi:hypothetical protein
MDEINSINSMLIECVKAAGGSKVVGPLLWPEKPVLDAQKLLLACLNEDRPEKLSPDQAFLIEKLAKEAGSNVAIEYRCSAMSYSIPTPIEPEDERARLQREFITAQKGLERLAEKLIASGVLGAQS